jgi:hypothetical protein
MTVKLESMQIVDVVFWCCDGLTPSRYAKFVVGVAGDHMVVWNTKIDALVSLLALLTH